MGFGGFFKKLAPWMAAGAQFIPGAGPVVAATITGIAKEHNVPLPSGGIKPTVDSISEAVASFTGNADALAKLKAEDQAFQQQCEQMGFQHIEDMEKMAADDRANARQMQTQNKSWIPGVLAISVTLGFFTLLTLMMVGKVKSSDSPALMLLLGSLSTAWVSIIAFYFGSSADSHRKTELMAQNAAGNH